MRRSVALLLAAGFALVATTTLAQTTSVDPVAGAQLTLIGSAATGPIGTAIAAVPNLTGDGRPALVVAAPNQSLPGRSHAGVVYVLFDTARTGAVALDDSSLHGFRIIGGPWYEAGTQVEAAGDVDGDGRGDILVTAPRHGVSCPTSMSGPCGYKTPAVAFVIYGKADEGTVDLAHLHASQGFEIRGVPGSGMPTGSVASAGSFAGLRYSAIAVSGGLYPKLGYRGGAYVIYGGRSHSTIDLRHLGSAGFAITAGRRGFSPDETITVADGGDVSGDGRTDLLLDAPSPTAAGPVVLFGGREPRGVSLDRLGTGGFAITGLTGAGVLGMAGVGDVNGDHRADVLVVRTPTGNAAEADVVYGSSSNATVNLAHLGSRGLRILAGPAPSGQYRQLLPVAGLGNGDVAITSLQFPTLSERPVDNVVSVVHGAANTPSVSLANLGSAGFELAAPVPPEACQTVGGALSGAALGTSLSPLGAFTAPAADEYAVGAPGLGLPSFGPCADQYGAVLVEP